MMDISSAPHAADAEHRMIYEPADALGFTAWTDCFDYQNGRLGLSFKEIRRAHDAAFVPPRLEMGEAIGAPVSYCSAECGSADTVSERVYMASDDGGEHWYETGRCPLAEGSFLNAGFADGRLVGLDVGRVNAARTGWCDYIAVRESTDGGSTWTDLPADSVVSMNLWGFTPAYVQEAKAGFAAFLKESLPVNPMKCEYYLPTVVTNALEAGKADVHVLTSADKWHGITYREDKPELVEA